MTLYSPLCSEKVNFVREDVGDTSNNNNLFKSNKKLILRRSHDYIIRIIWENFQDLLCISFWYSTTSETSLMLLLVSQVLQKRCLCKEYHPSQ